MNIRAVTINWKYVKEDDYVRNIETLRSMGPLVFHSPVTFFAGENGTGKSTLLEAIAAAYGFNAEGGSMNYSFSKRYPTPRKVTIRSLYGAIA